MLCSRIPLAPCTSGGSQSYHWHIWRRYSIIRGSADICRAKLHIPLRAPFSPGALLATHRDIQVRQTVATAAWYRKRHPTFADTMAAVRRQFWGKQGLLISHLAAEQQRSKPALHQAIAPAIRYAAQRRTPLKTWKAGRKPQICWKSPGF